MREEDVARDLERLGQRPQARLDAAEVVLADREAVDDEAIDLLGRLVGKGRRRRDHSRIERGGGGEDLHDRARDVEALPRAPEERLGGVVAKRVHRLLCGARVARDRRRVERRRRDEGQHRAGVRVERDDRPGIPAELRGGEVLEPLVDRQRQVARHRLAVEDVVDDVAQRVRIGLADQQVLVGALEAGAPESKAGVADDVGEGRILDRSSGSGRRPPPSSRGAGPGCPRCSPAAGSAAPR